MNCKKYNNCEKDFACSILGECVFGHKMITEYHNDEPTTVLHYSKHVGQIAYGVFDKIKKGILFNGERNKLKKLSSQQKSQASVATDDHQGTEAG